MYIFGETLLNTVDRINITDFPFALGFKHGLVWFPILVASVVAASLLESYYVSFGAGRLRSHCACSSKLSPTDLP